MRWIASATAGGVPARDRAQRYRHEHDPTRTQFEFFDTTYAAARFNNSATQTTVLIVQNLKATAVAGNIDFYSAAGALLHAEPLALNAKGISVINTAALPGAGGPIRLRARSLRPAGTAPLPARPSPSSRPRGSRFDTPLVSAPR